MSLTNFPSDSVQPIITAIRLLLAVPPGGSRGLPEAESNSTFLLRSGILGATLKHMLNVYVLGGVLTLFSVFIKLISLMKSLEGVLESPSPGSYWTTRGQLPIKEPPRAFQTIVSGILHGIRTGTMIKCGGSAGGIDIVACMIQKRNRI